jgi:hypothetical protein
MSRKLPRAEVDSVAVAEFVEDFSKESDRAAVIVGAARLDDLLYQLLRAVLLPCTGSHDELLEGDSPLSTFHARTHMAHRLGLLDDDFVRALHLVRRIRNAFAHEYRNASLAENPHKDRVRELVKPLHEYDAFDASIAGVKGKAGPSLDFRVGLAIMVTRLEQLVHSAGTLEPTMTQTFVAPHWKKTGARDA